MFVVRGRKNPLYLGLAARLKAARKEANLSRQAVTQRAKLSDVSAMLGMEQGQRIPRIDTVERVADAFGISPAFLAYGLEAAADHPATGSRYGTVSVRLREARAARGLSMRALARAAGLTDTAVRSTETGASIPSIATVESFATALGVSPGWLAFGLGPLELPVRRRGTASMVARFV